MRNFFSRIFYGKNGIDALGILTWIATIALAIAVVFSHNVVVYVVFVALFALSVFRTLSKNIAARQKENRAFLNIINKFRFPSRGQKSVDAKFRDVTDYKLFTCPSCGQKVRIPKGHGKVEIVCPKCKNSFSGRS